MVGSRLVRTQEPKTNQKPSKMKQQRTLKLVRIWFVFGSFLADAADADADADAAVADADAADVCMYVYMCVCKHTCSSASTLRA